MSEIAYRIVARADSEVLADKAIRMILDKRGPFVPRGENEASTIHGIDLEQMLREAFQLGALMTR